MADISDSSGAMKQKAGESGQGMPETGQRTMSTINFPYHNLESCIEIPRAVHSVGGDACEWNQLAAHLNFAPSGGGFRQRMISARTFGLIEYANQRVQLTDIGRACIDQSKESVGREQAFLHVPLFCSMFEKLDGHPFPPHQAVERQMESLGVAPKQTKKARQTFHRSATYAGYFAISSNRMTKPSHEGGAISTFETPEKQKQGELDEAKRVGSNQPSDSTVHPLIAALLGQLPSEAEGVFEQQRCLIWLQMMLSSLTLIYGKSAAELMEIEVKLRASQETTA